MPIKSAFNLKDIINGVPALQTLGMYVLLSSNVVDILHKHDLEKENPLLTELFLFFPSISEWI